MSAPDCLIITDDFLPHVGGSRVYVHRVATILAGRMSAVTRSRSGEAAFDSRLAYPVRRTRFVQSAGVAALQELLNCGALVAAGLAASKGVGCILAGEVTPAAFAASAVAWRRGVPYGVFVHDEPLQGAGPLERRLRCRVLSGASAIITSSTFAAARAHQSAPLTPTFLAPAGVDPSVYSPGRVDQAVMDRYRLSSQSYLLSVGRLVAYKNVSFLIKALAGLERPDLKLAIVGEGPDRCALEAEVDASNLRNRVSFFSRVGQEDLVHLYRGALVYAFPSRRQHGLQHEGIGMAALEAAACGSVVLASTHTSAGDFVRHADTGYLFDPGDLDGFVRLVNRLASCPGERERIIARASVLVRSEFTWERAAEVVAGVIDLLKARPASLVKNSPPQGR